MQDAVCHWSSCYAEIYYGEPKHGWCSVILAFPIPLPSNIYDAMMQHRTTCITPMLHVAVADAAACYRGGGSKILLIRHLINIHNN